MHGAARRRVLTAGIGLAAVSMAGPSARARTAQPANKSTTMTRGTPEVCVGRYGFGSIEGFEPVSRAAMIYRVEVSEHPETPEDLLGALSAQGEVTQSIDLGAGRQGLWLKRSGLPSGQSMAVGTLTAPGHTLLLKAVADDARMAPAEQLLRNVLDAYRAGVAIGFCVGSGSITSEPSRNERASVLLKAAAVPQAELSAETQTVAAPRNAQPFDATGDARTLLGQGMRLTVLHSAARTVAGHEGHEQRAAIEDVRGGVALHFAWIHPGSAGRADDPEIVLRAFGPLSSQARLDAAWARLLASFRRLPQPAR